LIMEGACIKGRLLIFLVLNSISMKMKSKTMLGYALVGGALLLMISSCSKKANDTIDTTKDQPTAISLTMASSISQSAYDDVFNQISIEAENGNISGRLMGENDVLGCTTVTISPADLNTFPKTMTIDYGAGCTIGAITRKGKLTVTLSGRLRNTGTVASVSFENYSVNEYKLEGSFTITNNTANNVLSFTTQTTAGKLTYPAGVAYYTHNGSHTYTQVSGSGTPTYADDNWSVSGSGTTTSSANESLTVTIKTPLIKSVACGSIISGIEDFKYNNIFGSLNFGEGTCDRQAMLIIGSYNTVINF
jgi:hypothetical protein